MPFTQDLFTGRRNYGDGSVRIGQPDRIWYDKVTHTLRISDGVTPGGIIILGGGGGGGGGVVVVKDESLILTAAASSLNFIGAGVTASVGNPLLGDVDVRIPGGIAGVSVSDEGNVVAATANSMNFVGAGVTATAAGNIVTVTIPAAAAASNTITVQDEGSPLSLAVTAINFIGATVSAVMNGNGTTADVTITASPSLVQQLGTWTPTLNTATGSGTFTYVKAEGHFLKTGRHVVCYFTIEVSEHVITTPSTIQIIGLPFTAFDTALGQGPSQHIGNLVLEDFAFGTLPTHVSGIVLGGTTKVDLYWHSLASGNNATIAKLTDTDLTFPSGNYEMVGTITYIAEEESGIVEPSDPT